MSPHLHNQSTPYLTALISSLLLTACGDKTELSIDSLPIGYWQEEATGLTLNITKEDVFIYNASKQTCSQSMYYESQEEAKKSLTQPKMSWEGSTQFFSATPSGGLSSERLSFKKLDTLPMPCQLAPPKDKYDPVAIFEHTWHTFNDYYPFFELRNVNWTSQYDKFRPKVTSNTPQKELFVLIASMLSPIDDGHIELSVNNNTLEEDFNPASMLGWTNAIERLALEYTDGDLDLSYKSVLDTFNSGLETFYSINELKHLKDSNGRDLMVWGVLKNNVGYLQINAMEGYAPNKDGLFTNTKNELTEVEKALNSVFTDLSMTQSMIVDIRFNGGGYDDVALAIAGRFTNDTYLSHKKQKYYSHNTTDLKNYFVTPYSDNGYTNPVAIITGPNTASAAEIFALSMKPLTHVSQIGEPTRGVLSDVLDVDLGAGWSIGLSHENYFSAKSVLYEGIGIPAELASPSSSMYALSESIYPSINRAYGSFNIDISLSESEFNQQIESIITEYNIPSLTAGWIDNEKIIKTTAFGFADIDQKIPATTSTPYKLGSISKTFLGVSAMQMMELGLIDLETTVADTGINIIIDHPHIDANNTMTLRHLMTHTASINDGDNYACSYYLEEDKSSLANALGESDCPEPTSSNQKDFLHNYLNHAGNLYSETENFLNTEVGDFYNYSNIGAALAAEMLTTLSGIPYQQWTEENLFQTIGMTNTHWFNGDFESSNNKPAINYILNNNESIALPQNALATWSDGDLKSSIDDLSRYLMMVVRGGEIDGAQALTKDSVHYMLSPQSDATNMLGYPAVFWENDGFLFGHTGGDPGVNTTMQYDQINQLGYILITNSDDEEVWGRLNHLVYLRGLNLTK
ncbi:serine hydrolase [Marinomonas algicola]|uniref:serine hydrolase n=1 Tax=Marinomonas algicola TaxID=2773454 RepID=UPI00174E9CEE|nr:serine hydrolase [Marinomonas algicola]